MDKPVLQEPFPNVPRLWTCPRTGLVVPKFEPENIEYRTKLLIRAKNDVGLQQELLAASKKSLLFWVNTFVWTFHQWDIDIGTGERIEAKETNRPFISWTIQDDAFNMLEECLTESEDILFDKARDMGMSWICIIFLHWLWLFSPGSQLLEVSRTRDYVDDVGNMKALFQKHDYINERLSNWMRPPDCLPEQKYRTSMHLKNILNGSSIDGESTTIHAARGDRRKVILLDEFGAVDRRKDKAMRRASRDAGLMRIVNSTVGLPGCEYNNWKNSDQIKVFVMPYWEHPEKGAGRYIKDLGNNKYEIRSPWFDIESTVRSKQDLACEVLREELQIGANFFDPVEIDKYIEKYVREPIGYFDINFKRGWSNLTIIDAIRTKSMKDIQLIPTSKGPLKLWTHLIPYEIEGKTVKRLDQSKSYVIGIDVSKGQGASNTVFSVKCIETNEKVLEWKSAIYPPYEVAPRVIALALWVGGREPYRLPNLIWENNGPGWDFGRLIVKTYFYPYFYRAIKPGKIVDKYSSKNASYGYQMGGQSKFELLSEYARVLATKEYINHSKEGLRETKLYIYFPDGSIGPAHLVSEGSSARKTHGDIVIADALTLVGKKFLGRKRFDEDKLPKNSSGYRFQKVRRAQKIGKNKYSKNWREKFDFSQII